jgi:hypothetical protein
MIEGQGKNRPMGPDIPAKSIMIGPDGLLSPHLLAPTPTPESSVAGRRITKRRPDKF